MRNGHASPLAHALAMRAQDEGLRWLYSKAQIIDELEATLPSWIKRKWWFPPFVHVLKVCALVTGQLSAAAGSLGRGASLSFVKCSRCEGCVPQ